MLNFLDTENNIYTKCKAITKIWANNSVFVCYWTIILHTSLWQKSIVKYSIIKYRHLDMRCIWQFFNKSLFSKLITDTYSSRNLGSARLQCKNDHLLECGIMKPGRKLLVIPRNILPPSSRSKSEPRSKQRLLWLLLVFRLTFRHWR